MIWALAAAFVLAAIPSGLRWVRVAQREHYLPWSVGRFSGRWWFRSATSNRVLFMVGIPLAGLLSFLIPPAGFLASITTAVAPIGLPVRGRTSPLVWTPRLIRVTVIAGLLVLAGLALGVVYELVPVMVLTIVLLPNLIDVALFVLQPLERALGTKWVEKATRKLAAVDPKVVAITGSYGKTTTKGYVAHLLAGSKRVVASPASFNNRMGLARAINENLAPGTGVFVAEMGTYGRGEIADLCSWLTPKVAAIVSIGPVHLERFKTEDRIVEAKAEILDGAEVGVICVDHPLLARLADERANAMEVIEVGTGDRGRVRVSGQKVWVDGVAVAAAPPNVYPANLAVAIGVALAMGSEVADIVARLTDLPSVEHRLTRSVSPEHGFTIIDDTFNSNPQGARRALQELVDTGSRRKALVTPGMVELGRIQAEENGQFATEAAQVVDDLVVVGHTNRAALRSGSSKGSATVTVLDTRDEAVAWVRANLGQGDAVLYENDLPDHYP